MAIHLPGASGKPRERGLTAVIDFGPDEFGWTGPNGLADLLACAGDYIDLAKIYALNALLLPEAALKRVVRAYRDADVAVFAGGILFEYCYLSGQVDELGPHLKGLGITGLEISENYIRLSEAERDRYIDRFQSQGFAVVYEFGRKNPSAPMAFDELTAVVRGILALGVEHIIVEQSEMDLVAQGDGAVIDQLRDQPWFHHLLIEADPYRFPQQHVELLRDFGTDVNLANVAAGQALRLAGLRRGIGRATDYAFIRNLDANHD